MITESGRLAERSGSMAHFSVRNFNETASGTVSNVTVCLKKFFELDIIINEV